MPKYDSWNSSDAVDRSLLDNDIHYLSGEITNENVSEAIKWILSANLTKKPKRTLELYINTTGGDLYEMFALIDVMKNSYHNISTVGIGAVMSAGFLIFASGTKGYRWIGKNAGITYHPWQGFKKKTSDNNKAVKLIAEINPNMKMDEVELLAGTYTKKELKKLAEEYNIDIKL